MAARTARLRVGLDARPALHGRTGFGRVARELLAALRRRDDLEVSAFGVCWQRPDPALPPVPDVVRRRIPARLLPLLARVGVGVETWLGPLDVFQHTDLVFPPVRRAAEVLLLHDVLFLDDPSWHGPGFAARVGGRLAARCPQAAAVVVPSTRTADDLARHGLCGPSRLHVVPLGCDHVDTVPRPDDRRRVSQLLTTTEAPALDDDELLVLLPGTREPRKHQLALVEAFETLTGPATSRRARLLLVGPPGWGCTALEQRLAGLRAAGRVVAPGAVDEADLQAALRAADVVAYPSLAEGFGLPVAEALACGRAVLTHRHTPMADFGGDALLAVDVRDPQALSAGLARLLDSAALRTELGAAGPAAVAGFTWDAAAASLAAIYHSLLEPR